jgi:uncharacterized protein (TIGR02001 family)
MNKLAMACGAAILGLSSVAQAEFSANIGATSNYVWRGMTQTMDDAAISGGIDYAHDSGFYAGTWASNVDFGTTVGGVTISDSGIELDFYGGFAGEVSEVGYDVGLVYYTYPTYDDSNFAELYGSVSYGMFTVGLAYTVDSDFGSDDDLYYYASAAMDIADGWGVGATIGAYSDDSSFGDYTHYQLDVTKSAGDFGDFTMSLSDNNVTDSDPLVFVSWAKSF